MPLLIFPLGLGIPAQEQYYRMATILMTPGWGAILDDDGK